MCNLVKKVCFYIIPITFLLSFSAYARVDCPTAIVENIQIEDNVVLYQQAGSLWRRLGVLNEEGTRERLSAMLAAQMAGKKVFVSYRRSDYDCNERNTSESAFILRIHNL